MKQIIDHFSDHSNQYKQFRPVYPELFYQDLLRLNEGRDQVLDCGTGNGQVAKELSRHFHRVYATDISTNQLQLAHQEPNIMYSVQRAEASDFPDESMDFITVAQAYHWFDQGGFMKEALRLLKPEGILAIWGYSLLRICPEINEKLDHFHDTIMGPYWDSKRKYIDAAYRTVEFSLKDLYLPNSYCIIDYWDLNQLTGYLNSWSSVKTYKLQFPGTKPVEDFITEIKAYWTSGKMKVNFPLFYRIGRK